MTLRFICAEIERLRLQIRGQQKETLTRASVDALCIRRGQLVREPRIVPLCANDSDVIR
jgi:hypothetical protein